MATLSKELKISGKGLMSGKECNVNIFPSQEKGIKFWVAGAKTPVIAHYKAVASTDNCVVLVNQEKAMVILTEHFMSACAFAGIDSLDICIDAPELPILDGSAIEWYKAFMNAGITGESSIKKVNFSQPVCLANERTDIALIPADSLKISYCINFDHPELKKRWVSFEFDQNNEEIMQSRTFGYLKDLERFQQAGMALGVTEENTIGLTEDGYTTELRSEFEPAKHKIVDIIGDLYLTGFNPLGYKAHIIAKDAGHKSHVEFAAMIDQALKAKV